MNARHSLHLGEVHDDERVTVHCSSPVAAQYHSHVFQFSTLLASGSLRHLPLHFVNVHHAHEIAAAAAAAVEEVVSARIVFPR